MENSDLIQSSVVFKEENHTYTLDGLPLSGITGLLHKYVFPDKYKAIPDKVLAKAAERGHKTHAEIQMFVTGFTPSKPSRETANFIKHFDKINFIASEYIVSDGEFWASAIDIVDEYANLYDIKTTSQLDEAWLSWQLSIYAYFFELQNPDKKAGKLFGVWLRDNICKLVEVQRIPSDIVKGLLNAAVWGDVWVNPLQLSRREDSEVSEAAAEKLAALDKAEQEVMKIEKMAEDWKRQRDELRAGLLALMVASGTRTFETEHFKLTVKKASTRKSFDAKAFREDYPEIAERYEKETPVSESLIVKIKDNE